MSEIIPGVSDDQQETEWNSQHRPREMEKHRSMAPLERWGIYSEKMPRLWVKGQQVAKSEKEGEWHEPANLYLQPDFLWESSTDGAWLDFAAGLQVRPVSLLLFKQKRTLYSGTGHILWVPHSEWDCLPQQGYLNSLSCFTDSIKNSSKLIRKPGKKKFFID